jgi:hypothetical protein
MAHLGLAQQGIMPRGAQGCLFHGSGDLGEAVGRFQTDLAEPGAVTLPPKLPADG